VTTRAIKGTEVGFSNFGQAGVDTKLREELTEFKYVYSPRCLPPLIDTDTCCLSPHPVLPERVWSV